MLLFDTKQYGDPCLTKFDGGTYELSQDEITKSFKKGRKMVIANLRERIDELKDELARHERMRSADDVDLVDNPYT